MQSVQSLKSLLASKVLNTTTNLLQATAKSAIGSQSLRSVKINKHKRNITLLTGASSLMTIGGMYHSYHNYSPSSIMYSTTGGSGSENGTSGGSSGNGGSSQNGGSQGAAKAVSSEKEKEIKVNKHIDQTVLKGGTTWAEVKKVCEEAIQHEFAAVCIPPCFVKQAREFLNENGGIKVQVATVVGFPFGNTTTEVKVFETKQAISNGADEIDMVINIGWLKSQNYSEVENEIRDIQKACNARILKVIVETGYLTEDEIRKVTDIVDLAGADFIKTSTGFGPRGASYRDVELFRERSKRLQIKAAGGVRDKESAIKYIQMGVSRIGTSTGTKLIESSPQANSTSGGSY